MTMFKWIKNLFDRSNDPVYSCDLYKDKEAGSCVHVDGPMCDFPECSMLMDYKRSKEGFTIKDDPEFRAALRQHFADIKSGKYPKPPRPHA